MKKLLKTENHFVLSFLISCCCFHPFYYLKTFIIWQTLVRSFMLFPHAKDASAHSQRLAFISTPAIPVVIPALTAVMKSTRTPKFQPGGTPFVSNTKLPFLRRAVGKNGR
jgi:hypothetical protein